MIKKLSCALALVFVFSFCFASFPAYAYTPSGIEIKSEAALLVSLDTGEVMYSKNADEKRFPASLTKLMTAYVVYNSVPDLDAEVTVPGYCITMLSGSGSTMGNLIDGEVIPVRSLLNLLLICSAADAANVLADYVGGGSISTFIEMMNSAAAELGMKNTHFMNAHGLHDDDHYTTANDMSLLAKEIVSTPIMDICRRTSYRVPATNKNSERTISTTNMMMLQSSTYYYKYASGMKTGFTTPAGRCLISTASKSGYNYLCVIMGGDDDTRSEYSDSKALYSWVFDSFEYRQVADTDTLVSEIPVELAWETDHVQLYPERDMYSVVPSDIDNSSIIYDVVLTESSVNAPVAKGDILGYARVMCAGEEIGQVNLIAGANVSRSTVMFVSSVAKEVLSSKIFLALAAILVILLIVIIVLNVIYNKRKRAINKKVKPIRRL